MVGEFLILRDLSVTIFWLELYFCWGLYSVDPRSSRYCNSEAGQVGWYSCLSIGFTCHVVIAVSFLFVLNNEQVSETASVHIAWIIQVKTNVWWWCSGNLVFTPVMSNISLKERYKMFRRMKGGVMNSSGLMSFLRYSSRSVPLTSLYIKLFSMFHRSSGIIDFWTSFSRMGLAFSWFLLFRSVSEQSFSSVGFFVIAIVLLPCALFVDDSCLFSMLRWSCYDMISGSMHPSSELFHCRSFQL